METYINWLDAQLENENVDTTDLEILDKTSLTEVKDIIRKFAGDSSFSPREVSTVYDTDIGDVDIDSAIAPEFGYDFEDAFEDSQRARDETK